VHGGEANQRLSIAVSVDRVSGGTGYWLNEAYKVAYGDATGVSTIGGNASAASSHHYGSNEFFV